MHARARRGLRYDATALQLSRQFDERRAPRHRRFERAKRTMLRQSGWAAAARRAHGCVCTLHGLNRGSLYITRGERGRPRLHPGVREPTSPPP